VRCHGLFMTLCVSQAGVASHIPLIKAILVLDQREGKRVAAKYYDKKKFKNLEGEVGRRLVVQASLGAA